MKYITILDYVISVVGDKESYSGQDHHDAGVEIIGGCYHCEACIASYNAFPAKNGYWACADCVGDNGFYTVDGFVGWMKEQEAQTKFELEEERRTNEYHQE